MPLLRVFATITIAILVPHASALAQATGGVPAAGVVDAAAARIAPIAEGVQDFTALALQDYERALARYATPAARARFAELDRDVWVATPPRSGWSYFVNVSVVAYALAGAQQTVAAFYNPWADVFLITAWRADASSVRLDDVEMVTGDWVRSRRAAPEDGWPLWLRTEVFTPGAVGMLTAMSVRAFERRFANGRGSDWRVALGLPRASPVVAANRSAAAASLFDALRNIQAFSQPESDEPPVLGALRLEMATTFGRLVGGDVEAVLKAASETSSEVGALLRALPADVYRSLIAGNSVAGPDEVLMFMLPPTPDGGYCLAFAFGRHADTVTLRRIDFVSYASAYEQVVRMEKPRAGGPGG